MPWLISGKKVVKLKKCFAGNTIAEGSGQASGGWGGRPEVGVEDHEYSPLFRVRISGKSDLLNTIRS